MHTLLRQFCTGWMACIAGAAFAADPPPLIDPNDERLQWRTHRAHDATCVLSGTAVSEMRNDAFEVQFRQSRGQKLQLFVIIPRLAKGGTVFMQSPTTRDRWKIFSENYKPALAGDQAESLRRNVGAGIPLMFTFEYGKAKPVIFETVPKGSITAASQFTFCVNDLAQESLEARETR
jgi:hypothetical protein